MNTPLVPLRPKARAKTAPPEGTVRAVRRWATCTNLASQPLSELQRGLEVVCRHPDAYSLGYSAANNARQRLIAALASHPTA